MIARVHESKVALWTPDNEAALRQCGQFAAYGANRDFLRFYVDDNGNRLSILEDSAVLYVGGDTSEMRLFLTMDPTVRYVRTDRKTAEALSHDWGTAFDCEAVMQAPVTDEFSACAVEMSLKDVYPVLQDSFGDAVPLFESWYADMHHRYRRGLCRAIGVYGNGVPMACAMTVSECEDAALIGAVATRPAARRKGYASACVLALARDLQRENKRVLLSPKNEYAHRLYERIGFTVVGEWGSVRKE